MDLLGSDEDGFVRSRACFETLVGYLDGGEAARLDHSELEDRLASEGRELLRLLLQDHLDLRTTREQRLDEVTDAGGVNRPYVEQKHVRTLTTIFGEVTVTRLAYRRRGEPNLHPADAQLNLPVAKHSHGLRQRAAIEASRGSFDGAAEAIERATGVGVGKRQVEDLAAAAAVDFDGFYRHRKPPAGTREQEEVLALSADGKGIVMRRDALRPATAKAAATSTTKLTGRLSKGEKRNRKRMAEVGAVFDVTPKPRTPADIFPDHDATSTSAAEADNDPPPAPAPKTANKWLTASVTDDAATVVGGIFDEANLRDPTHQRTWIALVDFTDRS